MTQAAGTRAWWEEDAAVGTLDQPAALPTREDELRAKAASQPGDARIFGGSDADVALAQVARLEAKRRASKPRSSTFFQDLAPKGEFGEAGKGGLLDRGFARIAEGVGGAIGFAGTVAGMPGVAARGKVLADTAAAARLNIPTNNQDVTFAGQVARGIVESAPDFLYQLSLGAALGKTGFLGYAAMSSAGQMFSEKRDQYLSEGNDETVASRRAALDAAIGGTITAVTNIPVVGVFLKRNAAAAEFVKRTVTQRVVRALALAGPAESLQEIAEGSLTDIGVAMAEGDEEMKAKILSLDPDWIREQLIGGFVGYFLGAPGSALTTEIPEAIAQRKIEKAEGAVPSATPPSVAPGPTTAAPIPPAAAPSPPPAPPAPPSTDTGGRPAVVGKGLIGSTEGLFQRRAISSLVDQAEATGLGDRLKELAEQDRPASRKDVGFLFGDNPVGTTQDQRELLQRMLRQEYRLRAEKAKQAKTPTAEATPPAAPETPVAPTPTSPVEPKPIKNKSFSVTFHVRGEPVIVGVEARNRDEAKKLAWDDVRGIVGREAMDRNEVVLAEIRADRDEDGKIVETERAPKKPPEDLVRVQEDSPRKEGEKLPPAPPKAREKPLTKEDVRRAASDLQSAQRLSMNPKIDLAVQRAEQRYHDIKTRYEAQQAAAKAKKAAKKTPDSKVEPMPPAEEKPAPRAKTPESISKMKKRLDEQRATVSKLAEKLFKSKPKDQNAAADEFEAAQKELERIEEEMVAEAERLKGELAEEDRGMILPMAFFGAPPKAWKELKKVARWVRLRRISKALAVRPHLARRSGRDLGFIQRHVFNLVSSAILSDNSRVIEAAKALAWGTQVQGDRTQRHLAEDEPFLKGLPPDWRANDYQRVFEELDKFEPPDAIRARTDITDGQKDVLVHFRMRNEAQRRAIIANKRRRMRFMMANWRYKDFVKAARKLDPANPPLTPHKLPNGRRVFLDRSNQIIRGPKAAAVVLSREYYPDSWGKQWSHVFHAFYGRHALFVTYKNGDRDFIGTAETEMEAMTKLREWMQNNKAIMHNVAELSAPPKIETPADMVLRLPSRRYRAFMGQLRKQARQEGFEIGQAAMGVVGQAKFRQKFYPLLYQRKGAKGFSTDFWRNWQTQTAGFYRWLYLQKMAREVVPIIEELEQRGFKRWADHLRETLDYVWGTAPTVTSQQFDEWLERHPVLGPVVGSWTKPMRLDRYLRHVRAFNFWRQLTTVRQGVVNSWQLYTNTLGEVGPVAFAKGMAAYFNPRKRNKILKVFGRYDVRGKYSLEGGGTSAAELFTPVGFVERFNQDATFVVMYRQGVEDLGLPPVEAAKRATIMGNIMLQLQYNKATSPRLLRHPFFATLLQYKRFPMETLGLLRTWLRRGKYGSLSWWFASQTMLGGIRAVWPGSVSGIVWRSVVAGLVASYLEYDDDEEWARKQAARDARLLFYGIPSMLGIDLSNSVTLLPTATGKTIDEQIMSYVRGPTLDTIWRAGREMSNPKEVAEPGAAERMGKEIFGDYGRVYGRKLDVLGRILYDTSPGAQQVGSGVQAIEGATQPRDVRGRKKTELTQTDLWRKTFGFRTMTEAEESRIIDTERKLQADFDKHADRAVSAYVDGDFDEAMRWRDRWNAKYPGAPMRWDTIRDRAKARKRSAQETPVERMGKSSSKPVKRLRQTLVN